MARVMRYCFIDAYCVSKFTGNSIENVFTHKIPGGNVCDRLKAEQIKAIHHVGAIIL